MTTSTDPIFGPHAAALSLWGRRTQVLAANIANADTPNYKARDVDFRAALGNATGRGPVRLHTTHSGHLSHAGGSRATGDADLKYRIPHQPALDGNSVEADVEQAAFAENALHYQASLMFISGRLRGLRATISGAHQ